MGRQHLPANGTQALKNLTNKMCLKTMINVQLKKLIVRLMQLKKLIT